MVATMSKASKSSLQYLLRQLYLAKAGGGGGASPSSSCSSSPSALGVAASASSIQEGGAGGAAAAGIRNGVHAYSTGTRAVYYHQQSAYAESASSPSSSPPPPSSSSSSSSTTPFIVSEWSAIGQGSNSNSSSSTTTAASGHDATQDVIYGGSPRQQSHHPRASSSRHNSNKRGNVHHYHRHSGQHHHVAASNLLPPSFWVGPSPSTSSSSTGGGAGGAGGTGTPPLLAPQASPSGSSSPFPYASTSSTSTSASAPSTSAGSTAGIAPTASSASSSQTSSDNAYPSHFGNEVDDAASKNQISHSALTLLPGAYGIPKRPYGSKAKGKGKEVDLSDPIQAQLQQLQQSLLSVQVGEDAYFVRHDSLGVADGVGGWSGRKGADPGLFAARLMHHCSAELDYAERLSGESSSSPSSTGLKRSPTKLTFVSTASANANQSSVDSSAPAKEARSTAKNASNGNGQKEKDDDGSTSTTQAGASRDGDQQPEYQPTGGDPIEVLHQAWDLTLTEFFDFELIGSSTALIALLKDDELRLANVGDCCCCIIRGKDYIFRSQEQQHSFNYPFQMGTNSQDTPRKDGQRFSIKVQKDDVVILSSDGLVDNLFDEDILEEVLRHGSSPDRISKALCSRAKAVSEDQRAVTSPFQQRANEEGIHFVGGKHDDISVLVAVIGDKSSEEAATPA